VTVQNLQVLKVDQEQNLLVVKGAVPGAKNFLCNYQKIGTSSIKYIRKGNRKKSIV